jgi:hypothetical protein
MQQDQTMLSGPNSVVSSGGVPVGGDRSQMTPTLSPERRLDEAQLEPAGFLDGAGSGDEWLQQMLEPNRPDDVFDAFSGSNVLASDFRTLPFVVSRYLLS